MHQITYIWLRLFKLKETGKMDKIFINELNKRNGIDRKEN